MYTYIAHTHTYTHKLGLAREQRGNVELAARSALASQVAIARK